MQSVCMKLCMVIAQTTDWRCEVASPPCGQELMAGLVYELRLANWWVAFSVLGVRPRENRKYPYMRLG